MAIQFCDLTKSYVVYNRPQDRLLEVIFRKKLHRRHVALEGIDFEVKRGETFGLIGQNGAGKSTLLKIAAGTILPTKGQVNRDGKVAALLELGAGFHPEESGYDNIRFMAALQGVPGNDLEEYVASAIEFSELTAEALSRPVKTYSSGMFMRLAFSTATAIAPDILIVDEALSVGDMHFQKKSLDRILNLKNNGATILFCSHNLYQVRSLCDRSAWIHDGRVVKIGDTEHVATAYEAHERKRYPQEVSRIDSAQLTSAEAVAKAGMHAPVARFQALHIETPSGVNMSVVRSFDPLSLELVIESQTEVAFHVLFAIVRPDKDNVFGTSTQFRTDGRALSGVGVHRLRIKFSDLPLLSGEYLWSVYILDSTGLQVIDMAEMINPFTVINEMTREFGVVSLPHIWCDEVYEPLAN